MGFWCVMSWRHQPRVFTSLLHADEVAELDGERAFTIKTTGVDLNAVVAAL